MAVVNAYPVQNPAPQLRLLWGALQTEGKSFFYGLRRWTRASCTARSSALMMRRRLPPTRAKLLRCPRLTTVASSG